MRILFQNLQFNVDDPSAVWQLLLRVTGEFEILLCDRIFYQDSYFAVVEFACAANLWLANRNADLTYTSMDCEVEPLLEFKRLVDETFLPRSAFQNFEVDQSIPLDDITKSVVCYIQALRSRIIADFNVDIAHLFCDHGLALSRFRF
jgi:hypothetical protein